MNKYKLKKYINMKNINNIKYDYIIFFNKYSYLINKNKQLTL